MADENETEAGSETETEGEQKPLTAEDFAKMQAAYKKASREAEQYRKKAAEFEDQAKTEDEKRTEKLTAAEKRAEAAERDALRYRVGLKFKLDDDLVERLRGDTLEDLEADAKKLAEKFGTTQKTRTSFDGGPKDPPPSDPKDMNAVLTGLVKGRR